MPALLMNDVKFSYTSQSRDVINIRSLRIERGEVVFLHGPSGSGKSTLLSLIGGIYQPVTGEVSIMGHQITRMKQGHRDKFRAENIGFIFQSFNLVPYLTVVENITLPCRFGRRVTPGFSSPQAEALYLAGELGIVANANDKVIELSIGQQQRVAAARALIGSPSLIIADEPTSALDFDARDSFLSALFKQADREGSTVIFVSHDRTLATKFSREIALSELNAAGVSGGAK